MPRLTTLRGKIGLPLKWIISCRWLSTELYATITNHNGGRDVTKSLIVSSNLNALECDWIINFRVNAGVLSQAATEAKNSSRV